MLYNNWEDMEVETSLFDTIFQYGVGIACLIYMMYFQATTMKDLTKNQNDLNNTLKEVSANLTNINLRLNDIEEKVNKKGE
jgi:oligoendopeptidase F